MVEIIELTRAYMDKLISLGSLSVQEYERNYAEAERERKKFRNSVQAKHLLKPFFYSEEEFSFYRDFCDNVMSISEKVAQEYVRNKNLREMYNFNQDTEELVLKAVKQLPHFPVMRIDLLFRDGCIKIAEINAEGSGGMRKDRLVNQSILSMSVCQNLQDYSFSYRDLFAGAVERTLAYYRKYSATTNGAPPKPVVAIVNFRDSNDFQESALLSAEFEKADVASYIVDPREFVFAEGVLYFNGRPISLVYNDVGANRILDRRDQCEHYIAAVKNSAACSINSFKGFLVDNKVFFAILHDKRFTGIFTESERQFIKQHIPHTGADAALLQSLKDDYLIKSRDSRKGYGVFAGKLMTEDQWKSLLAESKEEKFIIQEFIETDMKLYPYISDGSIVQDEFRITVGLFCFYNELIGLYSRASKEHIINADGKNDYYLANVLWKKEG